MEKQSEPGGLRNQAGRALWQKQDWDTDWSWFFNIAKMANLSQYCTLFLLI